MTSEELKQSLAYLDNACKQYRGTREDHVLLQKALDMFAKLIAGYTEQQDAAKPSAG